MRLGPRWPLFGLGALVLLASASGASLGYFMRFDLPDVRALQDYSPPVTTRVLDSSGGLLDTFAEQRRILIDYRDIPVVFRTALLATEDSNFLRHTGIDFKGVVRAAWRDLTRLELAQGASTLTQQLARNLFLHRDKTIRRKLQEAVLALEIERQYTKQEILAFYCNQIYMGHGRYGLEAAARFYFDKPARELELAEAAMLAGLIQRPEALSPVRHPERAIDRRNYVLRRMVEVGALSPEEAAAARDQPTGVVTRRRRGELAPYFVEDVRRWLQDRYGSSGLYKDGLAVSTTVDPELQAIANRAVEIGLRELDKRQGWRGVAATVPAEEDPAAWESPGWEDGIDVGGVYDGVVVSVDPQGARVRVGAHSGLLDADAVAWTEQGEPDSFLAAGDLLRVRLIDLGEDGELRLGLEQEPRVEGALVVLDPSTGAIRALVGGFSFQRSEFNRAIQAKRQTGSAFKPFVYAAALASGFTLADTLLDEPTVFLDPRQPEPYQPENFSNDYYGTITLRKALEKSANIATVKLLDAVGYDSVIETARKLGIGSDLKSFASLALGSFETTLLELTAAYGAFANHGVLVEPHLVELVLDRDGGPIERIEPAVRDAVSPQIAYLMNRLLGGVITDGTGRAAASLGFPLAGKTGTTDDSTDAWFVGYGPGLAVGVWVGFDEPTSLGEKETGARAALPIWRRFVEEAFAGRPPDGDFPEPRGLTVVPIDRRTGLRASPDAYCNPVISESFIAGTEPTAYCSVYEHQRLRLPYTFQRYPLNERGALRIPAGDLGELLAVDPAIRLVDGGRRIEAYLPKEVVSVAVEVLPFEGLIPPPEPDPRLEPFDRSLWVGKDGREARVVWLDGRGRRLRAGL